MDNRSIGHLWKHRCLPLRKGEVVTVFKESFLQKKRAFFIEKVNIGIENTNFKVNALK
jgi:hypothetical protein